MFLLVSMSLALQAQDDEDQPQRRRGSRIIDDTTKQIYGPNTSRYFFESDVFLNKQTYHHIDTFIRNFHRYNYVQRNENFYQDLGNIGTAIQPIYYQAPGVIGARSGFTAYDLYWDSEQIRYYDTKSPYSNMKVILGGKGRSMTKATYSRNISPLWNFGFTYRGLFIDKQIQRQGKGDRNVRAHYYDFFSTFQSKDSTYRLFFNFRRQRHEADEYGGIQTGGAEGFSYGQYFLVNAQPNFTQASTMDLRTNFHLFHQYEVGKALQLYHTFDRYKQADDFNDIYKSEPEAARLKNYTILEGDSTKDHVKFKYVRNEVGIKGNLLKLFYNGYFALRNYNMHYKYIPEGVFSGAEPEQTLNSNTKVKGAETYLGGRMSLRLDSLGEVNGWAELQDNGNFRIEGSIRSKWLEASLKQMMYSPSFAELAYRGGYSLWNNDFSKINVSRLTGFAHINTKVLDFSPGVTFTRLTNYVFFKEVGETVAPVQSGGQQVIFSPEIRMSLTFFRHLYFRTNTIYTKLIENNDDAIQVPSLFVNTQIAYENIFYNGNLDMHAGVDVHWHSEYFAKGYFAPAQQFYVQQSLKPQAFPIVDIFFNAKVKRGRIFFKYNNLIQAITKEGYMPTAGYPGQRNIVDFGFDWSFYD